jgi:hypothetical protein
VAVDLRGDPSRFRVSFRDGVKRAVTDWEDWVVNWETGCARWKKHPDRIWFPLEVSWDSVASAVVRLRMRQRRDRRVLQAPEPKAPVEPPPPPIPSGKLLSAWKEYLKRHPDPDKRPSVTTQRANMAAAFPDHAPPSALTMQGLRADPATPDKWRKRGRPRGSRTGNRTGKSK